ncbi:group II intron reverse transcriptase domain-containing protein [Candidatus Uhrbacteria bacterium]|nr:group II intron reverse transcriptase domain-containing protein [Candidatus Uhrbacteria bacterium]
MAGALLDHIYDGVISPESLLEAWAEFVIGKRSRGDVQEFGRNLMANLLDLHESLSDMSYRHGPYEEFVVCDPKRRVIHKATVRDRVVHHAVHRSLYPAFDRAFIHDSFSCRVGKGTHRALDRFAALARRAGRNRSRTCWVLKGDIRRFFASVDHAILMRILGERVGDERLVWLTERIVGSFSTAGIPGVGLPLGNLTSQLFANAYLNEMDRFVKHELRAKFYIRYVDDFALLSADRRRLEGAILPIRGFLCERLRLELHPDKVFLKTLASGVDFLGWTHFPDHRTLRAATRRRMLRRISECPADGTVNSYLGLLSHGNARKLEGEVRNIAWLFQNDLEHASL